MRTIAVKRIVYTSVGMPERDVQMRLGERSVELRLLACELQRKVGARVSILTPTTDTPLPRPRNGRTTVRTRKLPSGLSAITIHGRALLALPAPDGRPGYRDDVLAKAVLDMLDQVLPEYQLV